MKLVKVARVGGKVMEVCLDDNGGISQALAAANLHQNVEEELFLNHTLIGPGGVTGLKLRAGDIIILEPKRISPIIRAFIDEMIDQEYIERYYYEDENWEIDYVECYREHKISIDALIQCVNNYHR